MGNGLQGADVHNVVAPKMGTYVWKRGLHEINIGGVDETTFRFEVRMLHGLYQNLTRRGFLVGPARTHNARAYSPLSPLSSISSLSSLFSLSSLSSLLYFLSLLSVLSFLSPLSPLFISLLSPSSLSSLSSLSSISSISYLSSLSSLSSIHSLISSSLMHVLSSIPTDIHYVVDARFFSRLTSRDVAERVLFIWPYFLDSMCVDTVFPERGGAKDKSSFHIILENSDELQVGTTQSCQCSSHHHIIHGIRRLSFLQYISDALHQTRVRSRPEPWSLSRYRLY